MVIQPEQSIKSSEQPGSRNDSQNSHILEIDEGLKFMIGLFIGAFIIDSIIMCYTFLTIAGYVNALPKL